MSPLLHRPYWYLRHGQTDWNVLNLSQGRTDIPLNNTGIQQAITAGNALARNWNHMDFPITRIVSSPLSRARRTADIVQSILQDKAGIHIPLELDDELKEVCFGEEEKKPMGPWYDQWISGKFTPKDAEPFHVLCNRISSAVNRSIRKAKDGHVLIIAHGGVFRSLRSMMGLKPNVRLANAQPLCACPPAQGHHSWVLNSVSLEA